MAETEDVELRPLGPGGVVFLGLLAIVEGRQQAGLGRAAYARVERFARLSLGCDTLRLAVVAANPVQGFWQRMGFQETGEVADWQGEARTDVVHLMEKSLAMGSGANV